MKAAHWSAANAFVFALDPYPDSRWSGRGVVIAGGGKYWPSAYITVRMLRHVGCDLPVEVWYLGTRERDDRFADLLAPLGARVVDAESHPARSGRRIVNGFEVKLFAAMNSPFCEVLFLDADCYPCADPTSLFDDSRYIETGAIYWPDLPNTNSWTRWNFWGVGKHGPDCGFETGVYLVDKKTAWKQLALAEWYDDHSDWSYVGDHGDKGPHRIAWAKLKRTPTMFSERATWQGCAFLQAGPDSRSPMFVHRCRSKFVLDPSHFYTPQNAPNQRAGLPLESVAFGHLGELRQRLKAT